MEQSGLRVITSLGIIFGILWLVISFGRALFPIWRARAWLGIKRSLLLIVASVLGSVWINQSQTTPPAPQVAASVQASAETAPDDPEARAAREAKAAEALRVEIERRDADEAARAAKQRLAHWAVREDLSQIDDSRTVQVETRSLRTHANRWGQQRPLILTIICRENKTNAYISFAEHFMSDIQGGGKVTYRVDAKPAKSRNFRESNDHSVLGLWGGGSSIPWLRELFGAERLVVRATPFSESYVEGEFNISGLEDAIKPLRDACKW